VGRRPEAQRGKAGTASAGRRVVPYLPVSPPAFPFGYPQGPPAPGRSVKHSGPARPGVSCGVEKGLTGQNRVTTCLTCRANHKMWLPGP